MNYQETIDYLFSRLPMFHRIGAAAYKPDLSNSIFISERLGHPERKIRTIHVAGTNGKGSVSNMLASVFQEAGYKTGLFTSPHLKDFRERIRINGKMIGEDAVVKFVEDYKDIFDDINPSFFEWTAALAFNYFAEEKTDIAIIETGLGGRLDSTNIITPELSIITNISFDHMQLLGDTIEKIAAEKAGIIKKNIPVVIGERQLESENVFMNKARENDSEIFFASDHYRTEFVSLLIDGQKLRVLEDGKIVFGELSVGLMGDFQLNNVGTVLQSLSFLKKKFPLIDNNQIENGLMRVRENTGLQGRWQIIGKSPLTIADVGHNEAGLRYVAGQIDSTMRRLEPGAKLHIVFGMVNDKDPSAVLSLFPGNAKYYFCKADLPRALSAEELKKTAEKFRLEGEAYSSVAIALKTAKENAKSGDLIFIGGSTFVVAEAL